MNTRQINFEPLPASGLFSDDLPQTNNTMKTKTKTAKAKPTKSKKTPRKPRTNDDRVFMAAAKTGFMVAVKLKAYRLFVGESADEKSMDDLARFIAEEAYNVMCEAKATVPVEL